MSRKMAMLRLRTLGWSKVDAGRILDAARAQGEVMTSGRRVRVECQVSPGPEYRATYTITR